jgi:hypothetical protein
MKTLKFLFAAAGFCAASIAAGADPQTYLSIKSDAGDPVGLGQTYFFSPPGGIFVINVNTEHSSLSFSIDQPVLPPPPQWFGNFSSSDPMTALAIGQYDGAESPGTPNSGHPGLGINYGSIQTGGKAGSFHIYDIAFTNGVVDRLAVTFDQYSNGSSAGLHGALWYNSAVSLAAVPEPETYATLLAGLGLLGIVNRRRMKKGAARRSMQPLLQYN